MYQGNKNKSSMNHWFNFAIMGEEQERLFYLIYQLIKDMIEELVPVEVENYLNKNGISIPVEVKGDILKQIQNQLNGK